MLLWRGGCSAAAGEMCFGGQVPGSARESGTPLPAPPPPACAAVQAQGCSALVPSVRRGRRGLSGGLLRPGSARSSLCGESGGESSEAPNRCTLGGGSGGGGEGDRMAGKDRELGTLRPGSGAFRAAAPATGSGRTGRPGEEVTAAAAAAGGSPDCGRRSGTLPPAAQPAGPCAQSLGQVCTVWRRVRMTSELRAGGERFLYSRCLRTLAFPKRSGWLWCRQKQPLPVCCEDEPWGSQIGQTNQMCCGR